MKVVIYALGRIFKRIEHRIDWSQVIAVGDSGNDEEQMCHGLPVYGPEKISELEFDYIIICSIKYFRSIRRMFIGDFFISEEKILSFRTYERGRPLSSLQNDIISRLTMTNQLKSILDIGANLEYSNIFQKIRNDKLEVQVDCLGTLESELNRRLYFDYNNDSIFKQRNYDGIIVSTKEIGTYGGLFDSLKYKYVICVADYSFETYNEKQKLERLFGCECEKRIATVDGLIYFFSPVAKCYFTDYKIYVATHKNYNFLSDDLYVPICVGKKPWSKMYLAEINGENIAEYNDRINECTALYWMWKNSSAEIIGLSHYRRYFYNDELQYSANYLNSNRISHIIEDMGYDVILPDLLTLSFSVAENIIKTVGQDVYEKAYGIVKALIEMRQPEYVYIFDKVLSGNQMYICNMFVTKRNIMDKYCDWLFSFILTAADQLDVSTYNLFQRRTIGYFAEIMITCWIQKENLKIYELPVTDVWLN